MIKLYKFYDILSSTARIGLVNNATGEIFHECMVKNIPDQYDNLTVTDFNSPFDGSFDHLFEVEVK